MSWLYRITTQLYFLLIRIVSIRNPKARLMVEGRVDWEKKLQEALEKKKGEDLIWIHAASLGEFEQGRPVMEVLKRKHERTFILLTFFSSSGYEVRKKFTGADYITYLPFENQRSVQLFYELVNPSFIIFIKYEFWYLYLLEAFQRQIPTILISGIFLPHQTFFKPYGFLHRKMLHFFEHIFVQDKASARLLKKIKVNHVSIAGDTRYDRVNDIAQRAENYPIIDSFIRDRKVLLLGSAWPSDLEILKDGLADLPEDWCLIIAPHNIDEASINFFTSLFNRALLYTELKENYSGTSKVLIVNTMGMLSSLYRYSAIAFIGGGFRGALHNTLEAATWSIPVLFGDHEKNKKFREAQELIDSGGGFLVKDSNSFKKILFELMEHEASRSKAGRQARALVEDNLGATDTVITYIEDKLFS